MKSERIITKDYINNNIRPYTPNGSLFEATLYEAIHLDMENYIGKTRVKELISDDDFSDELNEALEGDLRRAIGYFIYSRSLRTAQNTVTKYGSTLKESDYSSPITSKDIVADSDYYKKVGLMILENYKYLNIDNNVCPCGNNWKGADKWFAAKTIGD